MLLWFDLDRRGLLQLQGRVRSCFVICAMNELVIRKQNKTKKTAKQKLLLNRLIFFILFKTSLYLPASYVLETL